MFKNQCQQTGAYLQKKHDIPLSEYGFRAVQTADGSWTLQSLKSDSELMHHSGGAVAETIYIYGHGLGEAIAQKKSDLGLINILSVGLGIGINEMVAAGILLQKKIPFEKTNLQSLEVQPFLIEQWRNFVNDVELVSELISVYSENLNQVAKQLSVSTEEIKLYLKNAYQNCWCVEGYLTADFSPKQPAQVIFFDAYSSKSNPDLWEESFLTEFVQRSASTPSVFSSYASKSNLQRALQSNGFQIKKRIGFSGKRECLFAVKGE